MQRKGLVLKKLTCFVALLATSTAFAQQTWHAYTNGSCVTSVAGDSQTIWAGTDGGGVTAIEKANGAKMHYNTSNSPLPSNLVHDIAIDPRGDAWFATSRGLATFDGTDWRVYDTASSDLADNSVLSIDFDKLGNRWLTTESGDLIEFDGAAWTTYTPRSIGLPDGEIGPIAVEDGGSTHSTIWAGIVEFAAGPTRYAIAAFDGTDWSMYDTSSTPLPHERVNAIAIDSSGTKVFSTDECLATYNGADWQTYDSSDCDIFSGTTVREIAVAPDGAIWIGTGNCGGYCRAKGMARYDGVAWTVYDVTNSALASNRIHALGIDLEGAVFIGTHDGLDVFNGADWLHRNTSNSGLPYNSDGETDVYDMVVDAQGNKWIATCGGVAKFDGYEWTTYNDDVSARWVTAVALDSTGNVWIGTGAYGPKGAARYDGSEWTVFDMANSDLPSNDINDITVEKANNSSVIWFATDNGLARLEDGAWTIYDTSSSDLPSRYVSAVAVAPTGDKWIATDQGLARFDGSDWTVYDTSNSPMPNNETSAVAAVSGQQVWVGMRDSGVAIYDGLDWELHIAQSIGLSAHYGFVTAFLRDSSGCMWIATYAGGLLRYDGDTWTVFDEDNSGLLDNSVRCLAMEQSGNLWIGGWHGISIYNENGIVSGCRGRGGAPRNVGARIAQRGDAVSIRYPEHAHGAVTAMVFSVDGRLVRSVGAGASGHVSLPTSSMPMATYIVHVRHGGNALSRRLVILR